MRSWNHLQIFICVVGKMMIGLAETGNVQNDVLIMEMVIYLVLIIHHGFYYIVLFSEHCRAIFKPIS